MAVLATGLLPLLDICVPVSPKVTGAGVLIIVAASATILGPATGVLVCVATAPSTICRKLVGAAAG